MKKITVIIACLNEEAGIGQVIRAFPRAALKRQGYELEVMVIDNNSKDATAKVARKAGAKVVFEGRPGKGIAIRTGMSKISADTDYVVMLDGDNTYRPIEIGRLVEPIDSGFCDVVIGSRLAGRIPDGAMTGFNRLGNWVFSHLVRYFYRVNVTDVLTGYFAWRKPVVDELRGHLTSNGFAIEMEMVTKMARLGHEIYSVPISYDPDSGETNLRPIYDGSRILKMFLKNLVWKPQAAAKRRVPLFGGRIRASEED